jgi:hypothetical protein
MNNKNMRTLLALMVMCMIVVLNTSGQTLKPGRPPMYPPQPGPTQPVVPAQPPTQLVPTHPGSTEALHQQSVPLSQH